MWKKNLAGKVDTDFDCTEVDVVAVDEVGSVHNRHRFVLQRAWAANGQLV